jgi:ATP-dependent helicase HrpB
VTLPGSGLPVEECIPGLRAALAGVGMAVLQAPPGAGKTTIVPLRLLDERWLEGRRIVVLEPRRLATRAAARRMASLRGEEVGGTVGFTTRDERRVSGVTRIEVVTEGVLTRRLQHDPELPGTGIVLFDEHHERNLQGDLGLALALDVRASLRPDLRLLVMSATLDGEKVARLLGGDGDPAPIIASAGRAHPVDVRWLPRAPVTGPRRRGGQRDRLEPAVASAVERALRDERTGDVLVFLPGAGEIRRVESLLAEAGVDADLRPLFGALPTADQDAALQPSPPGRRKVVLATDIAETSLTVEGVRVVVDAGQARVPRYDPRTGMTALQTVTASKASAEQRAGRAGRIEPGVAYRLWSKMDHAARRPFAAPEITQVDLAPLVLELACWGDPGGASLRWLDPPPGRPVEEGRQLLVLLGALDGDGRPTELGRRMADLPLHPRLARMVAVAADRGRGFEACLLAALLEERDVLRGRPDEVPIDVAERVRLLAEPGARHPQADGRAVRAARDRAHDLARRAGAEARDVDPHQCGSVLSLAYPERVAQGRGGGRFRLRSGSGAWAPKNDPLATETFLVAADVDAGTKADGRIRVAAALTPDDLPLGEVEEATALTWERGRDELVARVTRRLGALDLGTYDSRPAPGPATTAALLQRVRSTKLAALRWTDPARSLQQRVAFLHRHLGEPWPDLADATLLAAVDEWLAPLLAGATGRADLEAIDMVTVLRGRLGWQQAGTIDQLAPAQLSLPAGRRVHVDYGPDPPAVAVRVQQVFGLREHPTVAGVPLVLHLLSPADRPVQVTSDLPGFWAGSWLDVRKAMAGRYPKHSWPEDPTTG